MKNDSGNGSSEGGKNPDQFYFSAHRKRRDVAALLPFLGILLFTTPLIFVFSGTEDTSMTNTAIVIFFIWALLIIGAFFLSRSLNTEKQDISGD